MAIVYKQVSEAGELDAILALQRKNLRESLSQEEKAAQGFLTVAHSREILQQMHDEIPSVIAMDGTVMAGYALVMPVSCRTLIPTLETMFANFDTIEYKGRPISSYRYYVMGQICVNSQHRGQGVVPGLYAKHRELFASQFDLVVTEISTSNIRSYRAHERVGFKTVHRYRDDTDEWLVVVWELG